MQNPKILLTTLSLMAQKPQVKFDKLYQKLYNVELWLMAYQIIAPKQGNLTAGVDGKTSDGMGLKLINTMIADLKASRYKPVPVRRVYITKADGKRLRPLGIPAFREKLLQTVLRLILEAIYEPTFSDASHGFRPNRSPHTALAEAKKMIGTRWWIEGDIRDCYGSINHQILLRILGKRITDRRFLHLVEQILRASYVENQWEYHKTYSGVAQGDSLGPVLANIYLTELDGAMAKKIAQFQRGKTRKRNKAWVKLKDQMQKVKYQARRNGNWAEYKSLKKESLTIPAQEPQDSDYRRLTYVRYCDDFLIGIAGSKAEALAIKQWLQQYLKTELGLELSTEKTLITNAKERVRFLGYDLKRWSGTRILRYPTKQGVTTRRTGTYQLSLLVPPDKVREFAKTYGAISRWRGNHRNELVNLSELEILMTYNAEIRGFLGYYALADNLTAMASKILWLTITSFLRTLAAKRKTTLCRVAASLKRGPARYVITLQQAGKAIRQYELIASTRQLVKGKINYHQEADLKPNIMRYRHRTELGQRLLANKCEWCGTEEGQMEVHHVRKLKDLKGKALWEKRMIERQRKTLVLCQKCHDDLHAGRLKARPATG